MPTTHIDADVLIIGGGSAGCMAGIRAREVDPSARVVILEKGDMLYSGSIARGMDALNIVADREDNTSELYVESSRLACEGILDGPPSYAMAERSMPLLRQLEDWGVCFPKDGEGRYQRLKVHPKGKFLVAMQEPDLKKIIATKAYDAGCTVLNRTMGVELLTTDGAVAGALGFNVRTGEIVVCRAKSVILSNGGATRFGLPNSGYLYGTFDYPGNTGDGYVMAFRAGAKLTGFEYTMSLPLIKDLDCPLLYITLTRGAKVLNSVMGEIPEGQVAPKIMMQEFREERGPVFIRMKHLPEEKIQEIESILFSTERPVMQRFFEGRGVNFRTRDIELHPTETFLCGGHGMTGCVVNEHGESNVPGLHIAGDTACVSRGHLTGAFVFGQVCAERSIDRASQMDDPRVDEQQVAAFESHVQRIVDAHGAIPPQQYEYKVRRLINDYVIPPKNETKLRSGLDWMSKFAADLPDTIRTDDAHEISKALEIESIIQCAQISTHASLAREESRWGLYHQRTDFPEQNDAEWLRHVVLSRSDGPDGVQVEITPVQP